MRRLQTEGSRNVAAKKQPASPDVAVIGLGNWGTSLVAGLALANIPVTELVVHTRPRRQPRGSRYTTMDRAALRAAILWLCVPDGEIEATANELVKRRRQLGLDLKRQIIVHSSGVLTVNVLASAAEAGARVASVHPLMTFPSRQPVPLAHTPFAIESSSSLQPRLFRLARLLGGKPFRIRSENKILYHAAATMASPLLLSCLIAAQQTAELAELRPGQAADFFGRMAATTVTNYLTQGADKSFSGPLARGDVATIQLHLQALAAHPILATIYRSLARNALECLPARNKAEVLRVLEGHPRSRR